MDDILLLAKFRLSLTVVISSVLAYFIAAAGHFSIINFGLLFIGGLAITGAANGINQVLEKEFDALMERTKNRPLPAKRMKSSEAMLISGLLLVFGIILLGLINPLAAFLGMSSFILYGFVYTPLKRYSTLSVAIGAIPGALPVLIGVVAHEGTITMLGLTLFMIQFLWQFPHFWAISFLSFDDYDNAGYKLLPKNSDGTIDKNLGAYAALYSLLIIPTMIWSYMAGLDIHIIALGLLIITTLLYAWLGMKLQFKPNRKNALKLMFGSFFYLPIVLILYLIG
ncbi:MAG: protoheme IX farnesyltransferase [Saprospiraceae bacterium]|nr:heme o synthase [Bacteroidia bacterium]NNE13872.1 protoheme IX farnesyltransferase [Saprospiraceae bacterium]NNL91702.1 protoheme IX farnesyltransferase [Saprospiraceae bacterium]